MEEFPPNIRSIIRKQSTANLMKKQESILNLEDEGEYTEESY